MITIKTAGYDERSLTILKKALLNASFSLKCNEAEDCSSCAAKMPCGDLRRAIEFITRRIKEQYPTEHKVRSQSTLYPGLVST